MVWANHGRAPAGNALFFFNLGPSRKKLEMVLLKQASLRVVRFLSNMGNGKKDERNGRGEQRGRGDVMSFHEFHENSPLFSCSGILLKSNHCWKSGSWSAS